MEETTVLEVQETETELDVVEEALAYDIMLMQMDSY
jgi:hypothetical protein